MDEKENKSVPATATPARGKALSEEDLRLLEEADEQFIGSYPHTVDAKGRIVVPLAFREMLGPTFYIAPSHDFKAVALYSKLSWARTRHRYAQLDPYNDEVLLLLEQFNALSYRDQECDGQGRVLIPPRIRQLLLGDDKELEIYGDGDHVNITTRAIYQSKFQETIDNMPAIKKTIDALRAREINARMLRLRGEE